MKKKILVSIALLLFVILLAVGIYYLSSGKSCRYSDTLCLQSRKIMVRIHQESISQNGQVSLGVLVIDNSGGYLQQENTVFREQWDFGDKVQQPIQEAYAYRAIPTSEGVYSKQYIYSKPGTYTVSMQMLNPINEVVRTSNTIRITIPSDGFTSQKKVETHNTLFLATHSDKEINLYSYNPTMPEESTERVIPFKEPITPNNTRYSSGANDAIQFDPNTKRVFIATQGTPDVGTGKCLHTDGSCSFRIYALDEQETTPTVLYESDTEPQHWIVNSADGDITLDFRERNTQTIKSIDSHKGTEQFSQEYILPENAELGTFVADAEGEFIYQSMLENVDGELPNQVLSMRKFNPEDGVLELVEVHRGFDMETNTSISPDMEWIAYYEDIGGDNNVPLFITDLDPSTIQKIIEAKPTSRPHDRLVDISNYNLTWSGDSTKLFYMREDGLAYFDTLTRTNSLFTITKPGEETPFILSAVGNESVDYVLYTQIDKGYVTLYNSATGETKETTLPITTKDFQGVTIDGVAWY